MHSDFVVPLKLPVGIMCRLIVGYLQWELKRKLSQFTVEPVTQWKSVDKYGLVCGSHAFGLRCSLRHVYHNHWSSFFHCGMCTSRIRPSLFHAACVSQATGLRCIVTAWVSHAGVWNALFHGTKCIRGIWNSSLQCSVYTRKHPMFHATYMYPFGSGLHCSLHAARAVVLDPSAKLLV